MDHHDRRQAQAEIGRQLRASGWTLYGWKEDRSDLMTDYYDPESWDGIAERDGYIVAVDVHAWDVSRASGGVEKIRYNAGAPCEHCGGSGLEPGAWSLREARADWRGYRTAQAARSCRQGIALFGDVISPIPFCGEGIYGCTSDAHTVEDRGLEHCCKCSGRGHMLASERYREPWPTFQANPPRRHWHVERDGLIVASGYGLTDADGIVRKIEAATHARVSA